MRVFALGGYGKVGLPAIKLLAERDLVTEIAICGRNSDLAEAAASNVGKKALAVHTDGTDVEKLSSLLGSYDIIINSATDDTVLPAIRAAIKAGVHYCDVNVFKINEALLLDPQAKSAGITTIIAGGITPCISNLMGIYLTQKLDQVEQLQLGRADIFNFQTGEELTPGDWRNQLQKGQINLLDFRDFIAWVFAVIQENGFRPVSTFNKGQWGESDPTINGIEVPLTSGGQVSYFPYYCGDLLFPSLPVDLSRVPPVEILFSSFPLQLHDLLRAYSSRVAEGEIDSEIATAAFYDAIGSDPDHWLTLQRDIPPISKVWVQALGLKDDRAASCRCWFTAPMWDVGGYFLTSVSLAAAAQMVLRGDIKKRGVITAEKAFEALPFLNDVSSLLSDHLSDQKLFDESFDWLE